MIDLINQLFTLLGKRIWLIVIGLTLSAVAVFSLTLSYPFSISLNSCIQKDTEYEIHNTTYVVRSVIEKERGAIVKICINQFFKTVKHEDSK